MSSFYFFLFIFHNEIKFLLNILPSFNEKTVRILVLFQIQVLCGTPRTHHHHFGARLLHPVKKEYLKIARPTHPAIEM
jgi:hypothetical protein